MSKTLLEEEILAAVRRIANSHTDNEATSRPMWYIATPRFGGAANPTPDSLLGPFWSREEAEAHLEAHRHRFTAKSRVYCESVHDNPELRRLYDLSRRMKEVGTGDPDGWKELATTTEEEWDAAPSIVEIASPSGPRFGTAYTPGAEPARLIVVGWTHWRPAPEERVGPRDWSAQPASKVTP